MQRKVWQEMGKASPIVGIRFLHRFQNGTEDLKNWYCFFCWYNLPLICYLHFVDLLYADMHPCIVIMVVLIKLHLPSKVWTSYCSIESQGHQLYHEGGCRLHRNKKWEEREKACTLGKSGANPLINGWIWDKMIYLRAITSQNGNLGRGGAVELYLGEEYINPCMHCRKQLRALIILFFSWFIFRGIKKLRFFIFLFY